MLKNYFITAFRNLARQRSFSLINIAGLTLGISGALVIFLIVRFELSFDDFHTKSDRIYRVLSGSPKDPALNDAGTPHGLKVILENDFPEIEKVAVVYKPNPEKTQIEVHEELSREPSIAYVSPAFYEIFDFEWISGSPQKSLGKAGQVVIDETLAEKYFRGDAMGKSIRLNNAQELVVSGILKAMPKNTDYPIRMAISHATFEQSEEYKETYGGSRSSYYQTFVLLKPNVFAEVIDTRFPGMIAKYLGEDFADNYMTHELQPLEEVHFSSQIDNFSERTVSKESINSLALVGIFLLITACINFINLTTAQAVKRSKEVGVRKVLGSSRQQLIGQFMGETALLTFMAILISYLLAANLLPPLGSFLNLPLDFSLMNEWVTWLFLFGIGIVVSILAGFYPSLVLSAFRPVSSLKNTYASRSSKGIILRKGLIIFQFALSQVLIICTVVVLSQMHYFNNASLGFDQEAVLTADLPRSNHDKVETLRNDMSQLSSIKDISFSLNTPAATINKYWTYFMHQASSEERKISEIKFIDSNFLTFYGIPLIAGHNVQPLGDSTDLVVNETFLKEIGITDPEKALGEQISFYGTEGEIIGVVQDFHSMSLKEEIPPLMMIRAPGFFQKASFKVEMSRSQEAIAAVEQQWRSAFPDYYFSYEFLDNDLATMYEQERKTSKLLSIFAGIAIFIGCLGLYGLISFMAIQKEKEVGIRKVLGGSIQHIVYLFTKDFVLLLGVAFLMAAPVAYYFMQQWLADFTYSISISWWMFVIAALVGLVIALLTVSFKSVKAALANPAEALRSE
ncbi:putative ABC transport system permease protein [Catalinimonas alkaloidigena]|uniref:ABC transporter permease n=1 Tax=Catalinimonas alkaloidigena TaxID=1075417 RepID=UPI0024051525|nr:ABC transporter permease [Catalinimonas alkaloidigena]MDF9799961.1 putative ABC transport system permease protein [Catalinimonas alkaloidigena]